VPGGHLGSPLLVAKPAERMAKAKAPVVGIVTGSLQDPEGDES